MKSFVKKQSGIIQIPENFAVLEAIVDGKFRYKVRYLADPVRAVDQDAFKVNISVSQVPYLKKLQPVLANTNSFEIINNILKKSSLQKDILRSAKTDFMITFVSDLSAKIPNNTTQRLVSAGFGQNVPIRTNKLLVARSVAHLNDLNLNMPIHDTNLNPKDAAQGTLGNQELRANANSLLMVEGTDPAQVVTIKTNTLATAQDAINGVKGKPVYTQTSVVKNSQLARNLISSLMTKNNATSQIELGHGDFVSVVEQSDQNFVEVSEIIDIPVNGLTTSEFYFVFQLINHKGLELQTSSNLVNHQRNVQYLQIPVTVPEVKTFPVNVPGKVLFQVSQKDKNARGILIYRKEVKPDLPVVDAVYTFVGKIEIKAGDPTQRVEDLVAGINPVIYRFVPYTDESIPASIFASVVVKFQRRKMAPRAKFKRKQRFASLSYETKNGALSVHIKSIPPDAIAMKLLRRDLSVHQRPFDVVGDDIYLLDGNSNAPVIIDDTSVKGGRIYEYQARFVYKDGDEEIGSNNLVVEFAPVVSNVATATITEPQVVQQNETYDVTFAVEFNVLSQNSDLVKQFLGNQGLLSEFQNEITADRSKLNRLFAYGVERTNTTTGEIENFGIISSQHFSDRQFGIPKNVKPLDPGAEYRYTITTYFRNPETLLPTLTRTVSSSLNLSHTIQPYKWLQPITLKLGNLVSDTSIQKNHSKNQFEQGDVADVQSINISLAGILPNLTNGQVVQVRDKANLVQWKVQGSATKIDHFIILVEVLGIRTIVGTAHNISNSNYFQFLDVLDSGEKGALTYYIVPVYYDYSRGTELKTNTIVI